MGNPDSNLKRASFFVLQPDNVCLEGQELKGFRDQLMGQIEQMAPPNLLLNLKSLTFVDSKILGVIVIIHNACKAKGGQLVLSNINSNVQKILALTRLDRKFDIQQDANTFLDS